MDLRHVVSVTVALGVTACGSNPSEPVVAAPISRPSADAGPSAAKALASATDPEFDSDDGGDRPMTSFGEPTPGSDPSRFSAGKSHFEEVEGPSDGLGPVYNDTSCAACHNGPTTGGGSTRLETRFTKGQSSGANPLINEGGSLLQVHGIDEISGGPYLDPNGGSPCYYVGETVPKDATAVSQRRTTPLFGLGLVDAMTVGRMNQVASHEASNYPAQAGHVGILSDGEAGKFGWKCQVPSLHFFAGDAYLNEMGVTSPQFPNENCPQGDCSLLRCNPKPALNDDGTDVNAFTDFMSMLAAPPRGPTPSTVTHGQQVFQTVGCNACHTPRQVTGSGQVFHAYSDFLLHDMGSLGDGIPLGGASGREFRTSPLWGVNQLSSFLHDGRASSVSEAIEAHSGQGAAAKDHFDGLSVADKQALLDFVNSL